MEPPKCKLCLKRHYGSCFGELQQRVYEKAVKPKPKPQPHSMPNAAQINAEFELHRLLASEAVKTNTVKHCPTCTCKRVYKSAAERQKAYRERHKAANGS
jgi:hypothetical protein